MKHIFTLFLAAVSFGLIAQNNFIQDYPWNPDVNNDNFVGVSDLTGFLSVFGQQFGAPPEPCNYDGTPLEDLLIGITEGSVILDSIFIEYELEDVSTYYLLGCPDPVTDTLIYASSHMLTGWWINPYQWQAQGGPPSLTFEFHYNLGNGSYEFETQNYALTDNGFQADGFFGSYTANSISTQMPLPETWFLDEDGIHLNGAWGPEDWPYYANYLHIIPYWHEAE